MADVLLEQGPDGGDLTVGEEGVALSGGLETAAYLSLFGGNADDPGLADTSRSWWGNFGENDVFKYRSEFQNLANNLALVSGNLLRLEQAAERDLEWMVGAGAASSVSANAQITGQNRLKMTIEIVADGAPESFVFFLNWASEITGAPLESVESGIFEPGEAPENSEPTEPGEQVFYSLAATVERPNESGVFFDNFPRLYEAGSGGGAYVYARGPDNAPRMYQATRVGDEWAPQTSLLLENVPFDSWTSAITLASASNGRFFIPAPIFSNQFSGEIRDSAGTLLSAGDGGPWPGSPFSFIMSGDGLRAFFWLPADRSFWRFQFLDSQIGYQYIFGGSSPVSGGGVPLATTQDGRTVAAAEPFGGAQSVRIFEENPDDPLLNYLTTQVLSGVLLGSAQYGAGYAARFSGNGRFLAVSRPTLSEVDVYEKRDGGEYVLFQEIRDSSRARLDIGGFTEDGGRLVLHDSDYMIGATRAGLILVYQLSPAADGFQLVQQLPNTSAGAVNATFAVTDAVGDWILARTNAAQFSDGVLLLAFKAGRVANPPPVYTFEQDIVTGLTLDELSDPQLVGDGSRLQFGTFTSVDSAVRLYESRRVNFEWGAPVLKHERLGQQDRITYGVAQNSGYSVLYEKNDLPVADRLEYFDPAFNNYGENILDLDTPLDAIVIGSDTERMTANSSADIWRTYRGNGAGNWLLTQDAPLGAGVVVLDVGKRGDYLVCVELATGNMPLYRWDGAVGWVLEQTLVGAADALPDPKRAYISPDETFLLTTKGQGVNVYRRENGLLTFLQLIEPDSGAGYEAGPIRSDNKAFWINRPLDDPFGIVGAGSAAVYWFVSGQATKVQDVVPVDPVAGDEFRIVSDQSDTALALINNGQRLQILREVNL